MSDSDRTPVLVSAARLPIGRFLGGLSSLTATDMGGLAVKAAVERSGIDPALVDEVIMGNVLQAGVGQAPARQAAIKGGVPISAALTVNMVCGSGLRAVMLAAQSIKSGDAQVAAAGGMESMSNAPFYLRGYRSGVKFGDQKIEDGLIGDGLWCGFYHRHMGGHAEYTAAKAGITRQMADEFSLESHRRAIAATDSGAFAKEMVPVEVKSGKQMVTIAADESPRRDTSLESLAKLRPAFKGDAPADIKECVVTAGNAPGLNDGAAALVVTSEAFAKAHGLTIRARITGYAVGSTDPQDLFFAPIDAVQRLMKATGKVTADYDLIEANEAFAVQALADGQALGWDFAKVNVNGGAVALGHPIGSSGARILTTLLYALEARGGHRGLATLCLGGGNAVALSIETA